nr:hypothetical protein [Tanacetum cinerariifolium]
MLYEKTSKTWKWWIEQQSPPGYKWVPKTKMQWVPKAKNENVQKRIIQLILFIVDSGCTKHMTGNLKLLCNLVEKFMGTVHFGNDQFAPILGYGDLGNDLLTYNHGSDLYTISLQEMTSSTPICLMAKASPTQAGLWHRRLSHINFDYINLLSKKDVVIGLPNVKYVKDQLCSSCELSKAKRSSFKSKAIPSSKGRLNLLHMDLCGPMRVARINGKKYILVIVDDYSRYTWTLFLSTEFLNKTLNAFFKEEGIEHQTSTARTPEQNGVVERRNRTLVEAYRMMLSASKLPLFFGLKQLQPHAILKTDPSSSRLMTKWHIIINDMKPSIKHLYIFCCICYITRDGEILDKMKEKRDPCILVGYSTQSKGYHVYNKRTRMIVESIHIRFDEIKEVSKTSVANDTSGLVPQRQKASDYENSDLSKGYRVYNKRTRMIVKSIHIRFDEIKEVLETSVANNTSCLVHQRQKVSGSNPSTNIQSTSAPSTHTNMHAEEKNNDQAKKGEQLQDDEFTNPFCAPTQEVAESSSHNIGNTNAPTFNQP